MIRRLLRNGTRSLRNRLAALFGLIVLGAIAIVIGIILAVMTPWLKRLMGGVR